MKCYTKKKKKIIKNMMKCNGKVESSWEIKRQRWTGKIEGSVIVSVECGLTRRRVFFFFLKKSLKREKKR